MFEPSPGVFVFKFKPNLRGETPAKGGDGHLLASVFPLATLRALRARRRRRTRQKWATFSTLAQSVHKATRAVVRHFTTFARLGPECLGPEGRKQRRRRRRRNYIMIMIIFPPRFGQSNGILLLLLLLLPQPLLLGRALSPLLRGTNCNKCRDLINSSRRRVATFCAWPARATSGPRTGQYFCLAPH